MLRDMTNKLEVGNFVSLKNCGAPLIVRIPKVDDSLKNLGGYLNMVSRNFSVSVIENHSL